jgi:predicted Zn finger-like uncharacterized protein
MATLICPACGTRYEIKAVLPPEGRKVRCSKCAHVWQAKPLELPQDSVPAQRPVPPTAPSAMPPQPPPPPRPAFGNTGMGGFPGFAPSPPTPPRFPPTPTPPAPEADLAAQVARINAEAMAETAPAAPPEKAGGIFARLTRSRAPAPPPPPPDLGMGNTPMAHPGIGDASMDEGSPLGGDIPAGMDASFGDAGLSFDPALAEQAFPDEKPRKKPSIVTIGWLMLALVVASVIGAFVFAPSAVMSVLPGAQRLYAMFGSRVGSHGLAFEGVRYGWTNDGGQSVLEVQGDVVNLTSSPISVPSVTITLLDESGAEISKWTTEIGEEQLAGGERAPFLRQIPSPPSNVRSVKVHFARAG